MSAAGDPIPVIGNIIAPIQVGNLTAYHPLVVVQSLIVPVILGMDFLQHHGLTLDFTTTPSYDLPECHNALFATILETYKHLFLTKPGKTNAAEHFIPTTGNPVKIPPCRIPVNYCAEVEQQLATMLQ